MKALLTKLLGLIVLAQFAYLIIAVSIPIILFIHKNMIEFMIFTGICLLFHLLEQYEE